MKWTAERIAQLRELAPSGVGGKAIARHFGVSLKAAQKQASSLSLPIVPRSRDGEWDEVEDQDVILARWSKRLPAMKEAVRLDVQRIMLDNSPSVVE